MNYLTVLFHMYIFYFIFYFNYHHCFYLIQLFYCINIMFLFNIRQWLFCHQLHFTLGGYFAVNCLRVVNFNDVLNV